MYNGAELNASEQEFLSLNSQVEHYIPPQLVSAAYLLLFSLWHDRRDAALTAIRKRLGRAINDSASVLEPKMDYHAC